MKKWWKNIFRKKTPIEKASPNKIKEIFDFFDNCNRCFMYMILPTMVKLYCDKSKNFNAKNFYSKTYYEKFLEGLYGDKSESFANDLKIEKVRISKEIPFDIYLLFIPNCGDIGQVEYSALLLHKTQRECMVFHMEISMNKTFMLCEWDAEKNKHFSYGIVKDKKDFVLKLIELSLQNMHDFVADNCPNGRKDDFSELDLKHRLAKEIGIRPEMLDFYMNKFQDKVTMEIQGIDSSNIDDDIENPDEWLRYCQWEISQAKKRMSEQEINKAQTMFDEFISKFN